MSDDIPFEIWLDIFRPVFQVQTAISHPPSHYVWSDLNARLHIFLSIALVCKRWHRVARHVFFEDLVILTHRALDGVAKAVKLDQRLGAGVRKLAFSFPEYRCSASTITRGRKLGPLGEEGIALAGLASLHITLGQTDEEVEQARKLHARALERHRYETFQPSITMLPQHFQSWVGYLRSIIGCSPGLASITIDAQGDYTSTARRSYHRLWKSPNFRNDAILTSLLGCNVLRSLTLVDPSPLASFGPNLIHWDRLEEVSIDLSAGFPDLEGLPDTAFCPPRHLKRFRLYDRSGIEAWPLASDLASCQDLKSLELGARSLDNATTVMAIGFLIQSYQSTLTHLSLELIGSPRRETSSRPTYENIIQNGLLHFPHLESFHLVNGYYDASLFSLLKADALTEIWVGGLKFEWTPGRRKEYWLGILSTPSLAKLKTLKVTMPLPLDVFPALDEACKQAGIDLVANGEPAEEE